MRFAFLDLLVVAVLFASMLALEELGRFLAARHLRVEPGEKTGYTAVETAVFGLLGLFLAFTFSDSGDRFERRRLLIVDEANAIGTAWLRIDLLPADRQPPMRDLFRQYLDARLDTYRNFSSQPAVEAASARVAALEGEIWRSAVSGADASGKVPPFTVLLPALNSMFDIAAARMAATRMHSPLEVLGVIGLLALVGSVFVGYGMARHKTRSRLHAVGFAAVLSLALYVIIDLDHPRFGLIRMDATDQLLVDLRQSMK